MFYVLNYLICNIDINECSDDDSNGCNQICTNTDGSYACYCNTGYELGIDDETCIGKSYSLSINYLICFTICLSSHFKAVVFIYLHVNVCTCICVSLVRKYIDHMCT